MRKNRAVKRTASYKDAEPREQYEMRRNAITMYWEARRRAND